MKIWYKNEEVEVERVCSKVSYFEKGAKKPCDVEYEPNEKDLMTATDKCLARMTDCRKRITRIVGEVFVETKTARLHIRKFIIKWNKKGNRVCEWINEA